MKKRFAEVLLALLAVGYLASMARATDEEYIQRFNVQQQETYDTREIHFFELRAPKGGSVLVSGDKDLELVQFLKRHSGEQLIIKLEVAPK